MTIRVVEPERPFVAVVFFYDGDSKLTHHRSPIDASDWIDRQFDRFGTAVVATDMFCEKGVKQ